MIGLKKTAQLIKNKQVSVAVVCEECIRRTVKLHELNAFITETTELAMEVAKMLDDNLQTNRRQVGKLCGVPIAVKDNYCTEGILTSCASKMLHNFYPPYTATVVNKLLENDAILLGKTNMDEFAMGCGSVDGFYGPVRNPWKYDFSRGMDLDYSTWHIAGGSSGGSAVAVATGMVYAALGSDTGGSVRNPASYCGVIGLKPSYGVLSRYGLIPLVNSMDCPGILARSVEDCVHVLNILAGHDEHDSTTVHDAYKVFSLSDDFKVDKLHIGIPKEYYTPNLSPEVHTAWTRLADKFDNAGAKVTQVSMPHTQYSLPCYSVLCACEVASNMARYDGLQFGLRSSENSSTEALFAHTRHEGFNDVVRGRILAGTFYLLKKNYDRYFIQALKVRQLISTDFWKLFYSSGIDLLLTPTVLGDAPVYQTFAQADNRTRTQEQDVFTQSANIAGVPACSVPVGLSSQGLPIGLQLMSKPYNEPVLMATAQWVEKTVQFPPLDLSAFLNDN